MVGAISFVVIAFVFVFFLFLYSKRYWGVNSASGESRPRFVFSSDQAPLVRGGLDAAVVQALPITIFRSEDFKEGLDCSVCLSELSSGEEARLLPKCNHGFHVDCIDMWFHSHSTCPLCRSPVGPDPLESSDFGTELVEIPPPAAVSGDGQSTESPNFPTNVLFWGTQDRVSTGFSAVNGLQEGSSSSSSGSSSGKVEGMLVIEIPRRAEEGFPSPNSSLPSSRLPVEDMKSPTPARLRSLRRLLSRGKRGVGSSCSPRGGDIEQGVVGVGGAGEAGVPVLKTAMNS